MESSLGLPANIRLEWKSMEVGNTLAYYDMATITAVKSFIVQAPGGEQKAEIRRRLAENVYVDLPGPLMPYMYLMQFRSLIIAGISSRLQIFKKENLVLTSPEPNFKALSAWC
jgi:hypothetical protein